MKTNIIKYTKILFITLSILYTNTLVYSQVRQQVGQAISGRACDMIATGNHSLIIQNGKVYAAGSNISGQLGNGTEGGDVYKPALVQDLDQIISVTAGDNLSMALKSDGTVWSWGRNIDGALGQGPIADFSVLVPKQVVNLSRIIAVEASWSGAVALRADGTVWTWGSNYVGELGQHWGNLDYSSVPLQVKGFDGVGFLTNVIAISKSSNGQHILALKSDGTVWSWGGNIHGQLGNNSTTHGFSPVQVSGLRNVIAIAAGYRHSLAIKADGSVWAWGDNEDGQLGNGVSGDIETVPVKVKNSSGGGIFKAIAISAGFGFSTALAADGTVWSWGNNEDGQLGIGTSGIDAEETQPVQVKNLSNVVAIEGRGLRFVLAIKGDGTVWAWGRNFHGELGNGQGGSYAPNPLPLHVNKLSTGTLAVAAGTNHCLDLHTTGRVFSWGSNQNGQLGNANSGPNNKESNPVNVATINFLSGEKQALSHIKAVAGGKNHSLALRSNGQVYAWGENNSGQLGNGTYLQKSSAVRVVGPNGQTALTNVVAIAASTAGDHSLALCSDGSVWSWGENSKGQLGNGNNSNQNTPVEVTGFEPKDFFAKYSNIISVAAGKSHSLALKANGTVCAWGNNYFGQLGNGTNGVGTDKNTPIPVPGLSNVIAIAAGAQHSLALTSDGTLWAWGSNSGGQLGTGTNIDSNVPVQVMQVTAPGWPKVRLTNIKAIGGGGSPSVIINNPGDGSGVPIIGSNSIALIANGKVFTWGNNAKGQLGIGMVGSSKNLAMPAIDTAGEYLTGIKSINNLGYHSIICGDDWGVLTVGDNTYGQLGNGMFNAGSSLYE